MDCSQDFCGCITYTNSDIFSKELLDKGTIKSGVFIVLIIILVMIAIKLGLDWFIFKDYYPLK